MVKVSPSILSADFSNLTRDVERIKTADMLHFDVMDGHFVPNITVGAPVLASLSKKTALIKDVHLMISEPLKYIEDFAKAGADIITFHIEADSDIKKTIEAIKSYNIKAGLSVKPKTDISKVYPYLEMLDMVLIMTVEPGFGGQSFMADMVPKIRALRSKADEVKPDLMIQVDGGINLQTGKTCVDAGADVLVAGSFVFNSENINEAIKGLQAL